MSCRPSVESVIRTKIVFKGATEVPSTFQVTVCVEPLAQLTAVFGAVTANGPETLSTVTTVLASLVPPPPLLSRTVTRKFKVRLAFANTSPAIKFGVVVPGNGAVAGTALWSKNCLCQLHHHHSQHMRSRVCTVRHIGNVAVDLATIKKLRQSLDVIRLGKQIFHRLPINALNFLF